MSDEEVLLLRGDFPPDCTGFVTDILSHCMLAVHLPQRKAVANWLQTVRSTASSDTHLPPDEESSVPYPLVHDKTFIEC